MQIKLVLLITCIKRYDIYNTYVKKSMPVKVFHDVCIILYTCKSSLYFILVLFFGGSS